MFMIRMKPSVKTAAEKAAADANRSLSSFIETLLVDRLRAGGYSAKDGGADDTQRDRRGPLQSDLPRRIRRRHGRGGALIFIGIAIAVFQYPIPGVPILIVWVCSVGILRVLQERHIKKRAAIRAALDAERAETLAKKLDIEDAIASKR